MANSEYHIQDVRDLLCTAKDIVDFMQRGVIEELEDSFFVSNQLLTLLNKSISQSSEILETITTPGVKLNLKEVI